MRLSGLLFEHAKCGPRSEGLRLATRNMSLTFILIFWQVKHGRNMLSSQFASAKPNSNMINSCFYIVIIFRPDFGRASDEIRKEKKV